MTSADELERALSDVMHADLFGLRRRIRALQKTERSGQPIDKTQQHLLAAIEASCRRRLQRSATRPRLEWDLELPVVQRKSEIAAAIEQNQVIIVCGETGSGKSTQLPRIALELGRGIAGVIGHTQPRRIAARSVATRIAEECGLQAGREVGYRIRFTDASGPLTLVRLMTDGVLLAETQSDPFLDEYDTLIVDEAHERSLNIDFLLGYLKRLLPRRRDLKVIVTSATIDAERFAAHFGTAGQPAPVLMVSGRTYPVDVRYRPLTDAGGQTPSGDDSAEPRDWMDGVTDALRELTGLGSGHILVFLPTERDIREATTVLSGRKFPGDTAQRPTEIVPLFGRLSLSDQAKVFQPYDHRRIVLATNVAESSLTVPGIRYVIDVGTARISRYSARSRMQRLPIEPVSRASADQRCGRCGRIGPGICIRLYSAEDYAAREAWTAPEILRTNLAAVILRTLSLKLGHVDDFPFLDPPKPTTVREGMRTLHELGAIEDDDTLTAIGKRMAMLPVDPRVSRIILAAVDEQSLPEVLVIAAALECQDPRDRPVERQQQADEAHAQFRNRDSDFLTLLSLWDTFHDRRQKLSGSQLRKWCRQNFLSWQRMQEWVDIHRQLRQLLSESGDAGLKQAASLHPVRDRRNDYGAIHRALLTGFLANVAMQSPTGEYIGAGGNKLVIWPGSALSPKGPKWFVAAELIETSKRFARTVARIQPEWIEPLAGHLVSREYSEPHWDPAAGNVMAFEKVSLWGLPIVPRRKLSFARVDPARARELLIQHGLVETGLLGDGGQDRAGGNWDDEEERLSGSVSRISPGRPTSSPSDRPPGRTQGWARDFPFLEHNRQVLKDIEALQARLRRHDLLPSDDILFGFYADRIPADCCDRDRLRQWYRRQAAREPSLLQLSVAMLTKTAEDDADSDAFPATLQAGSMTLPLDYQLSPGEQEDGVTVTVPAEGLGQLTETTLEWLVPGLLEQKVLALVRSLPRDLRRLFVPAPETAAAVVRKLTFGRGDLLNETAQCLTKIAGTRIDSRMFDAASVPDHLRFYLRVVDHDGRKVAEGRNLQQVRADVTQSLSTQASPDTTDPEEQKWHRTGFRHWDFGDLPESIRIRRGGLSLEAFPSVRDDGDSVALTLCQTAADGRHLLRFGLRRLVLIAEQKRIKQQIDHLPAIGTLRMVAATIKGLDLAAQLSELMADRAWLADEALPRSAARFTELMKSGRNRLGLVAQEFTQLLPPLFEQFQETRRMLSAAHGPGWQPVIDDLRLQLGRLIHANFLRSTPWPWLIQYPRYLTAMRMRLQRMASGGLKTELGLLKELAPYAERYELRREEHQRQRRHDPMLEHYRWMLEEFRVSIFAQKLGTAITISGRKLDEQWQRVA